MSTLLRKYSGAFHDGRDLHHDDAELFLDALIEEPDESLLAGVFRAWDRKGITENEIYAIARIMRDRCVKIKTNQQRVVDIVGTGGSRNKTFNVSTASAFVVAGAGVPVAKHGNRAATSNTGSADVLSALGVEPAVDAATAARCLNELGICFMFAPNFHRLSPILAKVRRGLGFPTIFNCVGPLCNPAGAPHQLIGVWSESLVEKMANALARLGTNKSWIVHGADGLDEISLTGPTLVAEVENGSVNMFEIVPEDFGQRSQPADDICVRSATESAEIIRAVLAGQQQEQVAESITILNASAAFYLCGHFGEVTDGAFVATQSIRDGRASEKLHQLAKATKE
ncbi:MAG TPA: anthranilate phosphoribosyltransferase [Pyrinomonadaceae bacterium]